MASYRHLKYISSGIRVSTFLFFKKISKGKQREGERGLKNRGRERRSEEEREREENSSFSTVIEMNAFNRISYMHCKALNTHMRSGDLALK